MPFQPANAPPRRTRHGGRRRTVPQSTIGLLILIVVFVVIPILVAIN